MAQPSAPPPALTPAPSRPSPPPAPRSWPLRAAVAFLAVGMFGCDHATKLAAEAKLSAGGAVPIVSGVLELRYTQNDDTAFSLLRTFGVARSPGALLAMAAVALGLVLVTWLAAWRRATLVQHVGFALVVAGAAGNVVDRALRGYVVDFIHLTRWPVFNVADVAVVLGMLLLLHAASRRAQAPAPS